MTPASPFAQVFHERFDCGKEECAAAAVEGAAARQRVVAHYEVGIQRGEQLIEPSRHGSVGFAASGHISQPGQRQTPMTRPGTETVCHPTHDGSSYRRTSKGDSEAKGHDSASHGRLRRELHHTVGCVGKCQGRNTNDHESSGEPPVTGGPARRKCIRSRRPLSRRITSRTSACRDPQRSALPRWCQAP